MRLLWQFVQTPGVGSWFIRLKGGGLWTHVDLVLPDGSLLGARSDKVGGQPRGVQIRPPDYEPWKAVARISVQVSPHQYHEAIDFALVQIGKPYDWRAILAFFVQRDWRSEDAWYCSELQTRVAEVSGIFKHPLKLPVNKVDPCACFGILSTFGTVARLK